MTAAGHRAAVLGSPVAHSLSPVLHRAAYAHLGLTGWRYDAYDVDVAGLPGFLAGLDRSWAGLSLTMPLKAAVLPLLDAASPTVERAGGANTVLLAPDGTRAGENTDVPGIVAALAARGVTGAERAVVLGGGATARSAVVALAAVTGQVTAYVRDPARRAGLESAAAAGVRLEVEPWDRAAEGLDAPLVVATTPSGATDALAATLPGQPRVLFEVLYDPWPTPLAGAWAARGGTVVDGLDLLVHQAVVQVQLMTGGRGSHDALARVLRAAGERALRG